MLLVLQFLSVVLLETIGVSSEFEVKNGLS